MTKLLRGIYDAVRYQDPVGLCSWLALRNKGLVRMAVPRRDIWLMSHPDYVLEVLVNASGNFSKGGDILDAVAKDLGETGLFNVRDEELRAKLRGLINPEFHPGRFPSAADAIAQQWERRLNKWPSEGKVRLHDEFVELNLHYLMQYIFGQSITPEEVARLADMAGPVFGDMFKRILFSLFMPAHAARYTRARDMLDSEVRAIIAKANSRSDDVIGRLKSAQKTDGAITDNVIRDQVMTLLMAGFDSTATVTSWAALELGSDHMRFEVIQQEVWNVLGERRPRYADVALLPLLSEFVTEILREHPAFPMFFRYVNRAYSFGDHTIPAGATLIINLDALHQNIGAPSIPFGKGVRICPAVKLAHVNIAIPLIMMMQRFTWQACGSRRAGRYKMTRFPATGATVKLRHL